jgi:hypothetical protein
VATWRARRPSLEIMSAGSRSASGVALKVAGGSRAWNQLPPLCVGSTLQRGRAQSWHNDLFEWVHCNQLSVVDPNECPVEPCNINGPRVWSALHQ